MAPYASLVGRSIVVTGGSRGLGGAMAVGLLDAGAHVAIVCTGPSARLDRTLREAAEVAPIRHVKCFFGDVSRRVDCERIIAEILADFGRIDVLVNNAAIRTESPGSVFWRMEADQWLRIAHTNSDSVFLMSREVVGGMIARGFGKIVNVSTNGRTMAREMFTPYGPSKAFVEACTRAWSAELSGTGVTMNVLLPGGAVDTSAHGCGSEELDVRTLPAAIMVPPLLWLASDESNACSGQRLVASLWNETRQLNDRIADATQGGIIVPTIM